jgi:hypothetical protein
MPIRAGIEDEFHRVMRGNSVLHPIHGGTGGEWDTLRRAPAKVLRRLTGARWLTPYGMAPDQVACELTGPYKGIDDVDDAMTWFLRTAVAALDERRARRHWERHQAVARRHGYKTYYDYRTWLAIEKGYHSVWDMRRDRWPEGER